jgi:cytochrome c oxidase subunit 2
VGVWFLAAQSLLFYMIFRFRRGRSPQAVYLTGDTKEDKKHITLAHNLIIACDVVLIAGAVYAWHEVKQTMPPFQDKVRVVAQQWAWTFVHSGPDGQLDTPDDIATVDELHVKEGLTYQFELTSKDVLHSFFVPSFRLKHDAIPGRVITGWFKPTRKGNFDVLCAEICGIGHGLMPAKVVIESKEDYDKWMREPRT